MKIRDFIGQVCGPNVSFEQFIASLKPRAIGTWVLVEQFEPEDRTESGILLPDIAQRKPQLGIIRSIGQQVKRDLKEGALITFSDFAGQPHKLADGREWVMLAQEDVLNAFDLNEITDFSSVMPTPAQETVRSFNGRRSALRPAGARA